MKIELEFIPVEDKLPIDCWKEEDWYGDGMSVFDEFLVIVDNGINDPETCLFVYDSECGFNCEIERLSRYNSPPWRVTHWAFMPDIKKEKA